mgnify:CR=1 FL=1
MKFSENNKTRKWGWKTKRFRLSFYIAITIIFLVIISTLSVSWILYYNFENSLSREFLEKVQAESREAGQILSNRLHLIRTRLNNLTNDNTIRVTLMLGADHKLQEHLQTMYSNDQEFDFFVGGLEQDSLFSTGGPEFDKEQMRSLLSLPSAAIRLRHDETIHPGFSLTYTLPIYRQRDRIGSAAILYHFELDNYFEGILGTSAERCLLLKEGDTAWNLLSGDKLGTMRSLPEKYYNYAIHVVEIAGRDYLLIKKKELENLYFLGSLAPLKAAHKRVLFSVLLPSLVVILLSLLVSFQLSNKLVQPLRRLTYIATAITSGQTDSPAQFTSSRIREFNELSHALRGMLNHLKHAREMERFQTLFEGVADMVFIHDLEGKILSINAVTSSRLAIGRDTPEIYQIADLVPESQLMELNSQLKRLAGWEKQIIFSTRLRGPDDSFIEVECHAHRITFQGQPMVLNVARDITERLMAEQELQRSHATLRRVLDSIQAVIHVSDLKDHRILFLNRYAREVFGEPEPDTTCFQYFRHQDKPCERCYNFKLSTSKHPQTETTSREGQNPLNKRWYLDNYRLIHWFDGRPARLQLSFDITGTRKLMQDKEKAEASLRKAQKMEAIATLAGGVAHDLNNILSGIVSYPDILLTQCPEDSSFTPPLRAIKETGLKAAATVQDLLTLARRGVVTNETISLNEIIENYLSSPEHQKLLEEHRNIRVEAKLDSNLLNILGSPIHLAKTLMNLINNGAEAIQGDGIIRITTSVEQVTDRNLENPRAKDGEYILLQVEDDGCGISHKDQERIFEPFFTTKMMGRSGTGLGMAVVWGTVEDHEGFIEIDSVIDQGTIFKLYFPATREKLIREHVAYSREELNGNGELILVIDDIKEQRQVAEMIFNQLGYQVFTVESGEKALEYLREHEADLILLDMIMEGGMDGLETYKEILKIYPKQKAIISSGYSRSKRVCKKTLPL